MVRAAAIVILALSVSACSSAADKASEQHQFLVDSQAPPVELCGSAMGVRQAYADEQDAQNYNRWRSIAYNECTKAGIKIAY